MWYMPYNKLWNIILSLNTYQIMRSMVWGLALSGNLCKNYAGRKIRCPAIQLKYLEMIDFEKNHALDSFH